MSHERIYRFILNDKQKGGSLYKHLGHQHKKYRKRYGNPKRQSPIKNRTMIEDRPTIVDKKSRLGDWEIDTIIGKNHKQAIVSIVECLSKKTFNFQWESSQEGGRQDRRNMAHSIEPRDSSVSLWRDGRQIPPISYYQANLELWKINYDISTPKLVRIFQNRMSLLRECATILYPGFDMPTDSKSARCFVVSTGSPRPNNIAIDGFLMSRMNNTDTLKELALLRSAALSDHWEELYAHLTSTGEVTDKDQSIINHSLHALRSPDYTEKPAQWHLILMAIPAQTIKQLLFSYFQSGSISMWSCGIKDDSNCYRNSYTYTNNQTTDIIVNWTVYDSEIINPIYSTAAISLFIMLSSLLNLPERTSYLMDKNKFGKRKFLQLSSYFVDALIVFPLQLIRMLYCYWYWSWNIIPGDLNSDYSFDSLNSTLWVLGVS